MAKEGTPTVNGTTIREMRKLLGIHGQDLARRAGISATYLSEIEKGHKQPSNPVLHKIAGALGVDVASLFCPLSKETAKLVGGTARAS